MSNIGKQSISIPDGTIVTINDGAVLVKGKLGELSINYNTKILVEQSDNTIKVSRKENNKNDRELHGLYRALIFNMIKGVNEGFSKELHLNGVGYTAEIKNNFLLITAGYSHPVFVQIPANIKIETPNNTTILIKGINKQHVGEIAAKIRGIRKPEPYKGKGIKYSDEVIRRKAGKTVGASGG